MLDESTVHQALRNVVDPGLAESIVDLGWTGPVRVEARGNVIVVITPPAPAYSLAEVMASVREAIEALPGVRQVDVQLAWNPPWSPYQMADHLKAAFGLPDQEPDSVSAPLKRPKATRPGWLSRMFGQ